MTNLSRLAACILCLAVALTPAGAQGPNLLANPGFENGAFSGWCPFGNAFVEMDNGIQFVANSGSYLVSIFGGFWGANVFNVGGVFQSFPASPGETFELDCYSRHFSGDAIGGLGAPNDNWCVMRIAFFDAANLEISGVDRTILDGTFATDVWHDNEPVFGIAPPGTVTVQALIMFLQPSLAPGAGHFDDAVFRRSFGVVASQDATTNDLTLGLDYGDALVPFGIFYSFDPANGTMPGSGTIGGLVIAPGDFNAQFAAAISGTPPFGGFLDSTGASSSIIPGSLVGFLSGTDVWVVGAQQTLAGPIGFTPVRQYTFQ